MVHLKNLSNGWRGPSGVYIVVLIVTIALFTQSCRAMKETNDTLVSRKEITREVPRDTSVILKPDKATVKAELARDSSGNVAIKRLIEYDAGERLKPPKLEVKDNILTVTAEIDSMAIFLTLKDRYIERADTLTRVETKVVEVNRLNGWQRFRVWIGTIVLFLVPAGIFIYSRKKLIR